MVCGKIESKLEIELDSSRKMVAREIEKRRRSRR